MSHDLTINHMAGSLVNSKPEYKVMAKNIQDKMPAVIQNSSNFYKSHSQFMQVSLDITALTPIRSIKQVLAEIENTRQALQTAYIDCRKAKNKLAKKKFKLENPKEPLDQFEKESIEIDILKIESSLSNSENYISGAVRKLNFLVNQHENLLKKLGKDYITEEDYEREEIRYHILTCLKQALCAARSRNGIIDEGNFIYLFELGINATVVQAEMLAYLSMEQAMIAEGKIPSHEITLKWMETCAEKWLNEPGKFIANRGFIALDKSSLTNLLEKTED